MEEPALSLTVRGALACLVLLAACVRGAPAPPPGDSAGTDTSGGETGDSSGGEETGDTGCTPNEEGLEGEARIVCAPGTYGDDGYCVTTEAPTVWVTMSCEAYAESGEQVLHQEFGHCAAELGVECCDCTFDLDPTCDPCEVND